MTRQRSRQHRARWNAALALCAALILLTSGLSTGARWFQEVPLQPSRTGTVTVGGLSISAGAQTYTVASRYATDTRFASLPACAQVPTGFQKCATVSRTQLEAFRVMRGDRITYRGSFAVSATGKNLRYRVTATTPTRLPATWNDTLTVSPTGEAVGNQSVTATRLMTFDGAAGSTSWTTVLQSVTLVPFEVSVVQTNR